MPKFYGDVREYAIFRADIKHAIESRYSNWTQSRFSARVFKASHWNWLKESGQITTQHGII